MDIVLSIAVWGIIIFLVLAWLGSGSGGSGSDFDTKDPGDFC